MKVTVLVIRLALGGLLLYAGLGEIRQPFTFLAAVNAYRLTGPTSGVLVAAVVPWLEVITGLCLVAGLLTQGALLLATLLTAVFSLAILSAWYRGLGISCGCFGDGGGVIGVATVLRSLILLAVSAVGLAGSRSAQRDVSHFPNESVPSWLPNPATHSRGLQGILLPLTGRLAKRDSIATARRCEVDACEAEAGSGSRVNGWQSKST